MALSFAAAPTRLAVARPRRGALRVQAFKVTMETPEGCKKFTVAADKSLLEGALAAGIEVPHLCRTGTCGVCAAKVLAGNVERTDLLLDEDQARAGFALLCTTTATSDVTVRTQQEAQLHTELSCP